jgi:DNA-binding Lrp family transcriptional regulator
MSAKAYILIETAVGKTQEVANALRSRPGVKSVDSVTGPYDVIAVVEAADLNAVGLLVTSRMHNINGIVRTVTCLSMSGS